MRALFTKLKNIFSTNCKHPAMAKKKKKLAMRQREEQALAAAMID